MAEVETALNNLGTAIVSELVAAQHRYGRVATGKTVNAIELHVSPDRVYITGPAHLIALEKGRRRTGSAGPVDVQRYGGLSFKDSLRLWMEAKGIPEGKIPKNGGYGPILWAIYTKINKEGYAGSPGVLSKPLSDEAIYKALNDNLGPLAGLFAKRIIDLM